MDDDRGMRVVNSNSTGMGRERKNGSLKEKKREPERDIGREREIADLWNVKKT